MHNFIWVSSSMLDKKTNDAIPKKMPREMAGWTGPIL